MNTASPGPELDPFLRRRQQAATAGADEVEARRRLRGKADAPRLRQYAAAIVDAIEPQPAQHLGQRIAGAGTGVWTNGQAFWRFYHGSSRRSLPMLARSAVGEVAMSNPQPPSPSSDCACQPHRTHRPRLGGGRVPVTWRVRPGHRRIPSRQPADPDGTRSRRDRRHGRPGRDRDRRGRRRRRAEPGDRHPEHRPQARDVDADVAAGSVEPAGRGRHRAGRAARCARDARHRPRRLLVDGGGPCDAPGAGAAGAARHLDHPHRRFRRHRQRSAGRRLCRRPLGMARGVRHRRRRRRA